MPSYFEERMAAIRADSSLVKNAPLRTTANAATPVAGYVYFQANERCFRSVPLWPGNPSRLQLQEWRDEMSVWKSDEIAAERRKRAEAELASATREQLLDRIVALETSLYKMTYSLNELDIEPEPRASAWMSSKLFPHRWLADQNAEFSVFDKDTRKFVAATVTPENMHEIDYELDESVEIRDGSKLPDDFQILSVNQSAMCASIYGGAICMGDVREAARLLWGKSPSPSQE
jgi:hypothetical protein